MIVPRKALQQNTVASHYDDLDQFYRDIWGEHVHHGLWLTGRENPQQAVEQLVVHVAQRAAVAQGDRVCDVGCGYGGTSRILAHEYGAEVTALTISPAQHKYASEKEPDQSNPVYLLRDWCENQLPPASFDVVISIESSEHMPDKAAFFAEVSRVLRPGGRFVVCAWLARSGARAWEIDHLLEPICREGRLPGMGTAEEYHQFARDAGLNPTGFDDLSRQVKRTWPLCAWRMIKGLIREPAYRRFLFVEKSPDRIFALTVFRIWMAYRTGSMQYGILTALKPAEIEAGCSPVAYNALRGS
ncbi:MAG: methyltransferase type 11 [Planctomycetota bacterium]|nr:methyltransferase type 11 [Planctomycetota bacterium]